MVTKVGGPTEDRIAKKRSKNSTIKPLHGGGGLGGKGKKTKKKREQAPSGGGGLGGNGKKT